MTEDIESQVAERVQAESEAHGGVTDKGGGLSSRFVRDCLHANELGDGIVFATLHQGKFVFCKSMDTWLVWQGHHWAIDEMDGARAAVEDVVRVYDEEVIRIYGEIAKLRGQSDSESKIQQLENTIGDIIKRIWGLRSMRRRENCLRAAHTNSQPLAIHGRELDQNPWLLPCANGVVDLKTGLLKDGRPKDYMLRACPTEFQGIDADRGAWEKALVEIFEDDDLVVAYMQRLLGMALVGGVIEHVFPVLTGLGGRNGKGTIIETIAKVLGPLAAPIRSEMLIDTYQVQSSGGPTPDIMALRGLRFAWASETKEGAKISAAKVKWLTGGDTLSGRNPHDKYETSFAPTHTLFLLSNFKPHASADDKAFWERMQNIPFNVRFLKNREPSADNERRADLFLKEKLAAQAPGILGWLVEGCLKWQMEGLKPPPKVVHETQDYMAEEDHLATFIDHCLDIREDLSVGATDLYDVFGRWWKPYTGSRFVPSQKKFGKQMRERFTSEKTGGVYRYYGVGINEAWEILMCGD